MSLSVFTVVRGMSVTSLTCVLYCTTLGPSQVDCRWLAGKGSRSEISECLRDLGVFGYVTS